MEIDKVKVDCYGIKRYEKSMKNGNQISRILKKTQQYFSTLLSTNLFKTNNFYYKLKIL